MRIEDHGLNKQGQRIFFLDSDAGGNFVYVERSRRGDYQMITPLANRSARAATISMIKLFAVFFESGK